MDDIEVKVKDWQSDGWLEVNEECVKQIIKVNDYTIYTVEDSIYGILTTIVVNKKGEVTNVSAK